MQDMAIKNTFSSKHVYVYCSVSNPDQVIIGLLDPDQYCDTETGLKTLQKQSWHFQLYVRSE